MLLKSPHATLSFRRRPDDNLSDIAQLCSCCEPKKRHSPKFKICSRCMVWSFRNRASLGFVESIAPRFSACDSSLNRKSIRRPDRRHLVHRCRPRRNQPKAGKCAISEAQCNLRHRPCGSASLPNRPRRLPLWGGLASKRWGVLRRLYAAAVNCTTFSRFCAS